MKLYILIIIDALILSTAQILLKKGATALKAISFSSVDFWNSFFLIFKNIYIWSGLFLMGIAFIIWLFILYRIDLSIIYPISTSLTLIFVVVGSWLFLREAYTVVQIISTLCIILGIFFLLKP